HDRSVAAGLHRGAPARDSRSLGQGRRGRGAMTGAAAARERLRERLLEATLDHVPFDGWTHAALKAGARDAGIAPAMAENLFPGGDKKIIEVLNRIADRRMVKELEELDPASMRVRDRIATATRLRMEQNAAHREAIRQSGAVLA